MKNHENRFLKRPWTRGKGTINTTRGRGMGEFLERTQRWNFLNGIWNLRPPCWSLRIPKMGFLRALIIFYMYARTFYKKWRKTNIMPWNFQSWVATVFFYHGRKKRCGGRRGNVTKAQKLSVKNENCPWKKSKFCPWKKEFAREKTIKNDKIARERKTVGREKS